MTELNVHKYNTNANMCLLQSALNESEQERSYLYIWSLLKLEAHLSKTNQTIFIRNMNLLCYLTQKTDKKKRRRKLATIFKVLCKIKINFLNYILL